MPVKIKKSLFLVLFLLISGTSCYGLEMLFPLYKYPTWWDSESYIWDDIADANGRIDITAIINPHNGPGGSPNADYKQGLDDLANGDVKLYGYVSTAYGSRDIDSVKHDIDLYKKYFFPLWKSSFTGIFLDEVSTSTNQVYYDYYGELYNYVKNQVGFDTVVLNHGTHAPEAYTQHADINVIFEDNYASWINYSPDPFVSNYSPAQFAGIIHTASESQVDDAISLAIERGFGHLFITDDIMPNPYGSLPSFWGQEINAIESVSAVPEPATIFFLSSGLFGLLGYRMKAKKGRWMKYGGLAQGVGNDLLNRSRCKS